MQVHKQINNHTTKTPTPDKPSQQHHHGEENEKHDQKKQQQQQRPHNCVWSLQLDGNLNNAQLLTAFSFTFAPLFNNSSTTLAWPPCAAKCNGVI